MNDEEKEIWDAGFKEGFDFGFRIGESNSEDRVCHNCKHFMEDREPGKIFKTGECELPALLDGKINKLDEACEHFEPLIIKNKK